MARVSGLYSFLLICSLVLVSQSPVSSETERLGKRPPIEKGLSWNYYSIIDCPLGVENIISNYLKDVFKKDSGIAAGILRIFFHDCFSQGCDASILLNATEGGDDEKHNFANFALRAEALEVLDALRYRINKECLRPTAVSCTDILVIAAREAVRQLGGPNFDVPLGRKDSKDFDVDSGDNLPPPTATAEELMEIFAEKNFTAEEMVALSGAHTIGIAHCASFYNRVEDAEPPLSPELRDKILATCPESKTFNSLDLDVKTPNQFDNSFFIDLLTNQGVLTSDQTLMANPVTKEFVEKFAYDKQAFFNKFADAFVKVSQINVITDRIRKKEGEIRKKCYQPRKRIIPKSSMVESAEEI